MELHYSGPRKEFLKMCLPMFQKGFDFRKPYVNKNKIKWPYLKYFMLGILMNKTWFTLMVAEGRDFKIHWFENNQHLVITLKP